MTWKEWLAQTSRDDERWPITDMLGPSSDGVLR